MNEEKKSIIDLMLLAKSQSCKYVELVNGKNIDGIDTPTLLYFATIDEALSFSSRHKLLNYFDYEWFKIGSEILTIKCNLK